VLNCAPQSPLLLTLHTVTHVLFQIYCTVGQSVSLLRYDSVHIFMYTHTQVNGHLPGEHELASCPSPHPQPFYGPSFRDHPGEPVPEENFWTLWCKGRLTEADTQTIRLGATPSGLTSAHLHHPPIFYRPDALPVAQPTVSKH